MIEPQVALDGMGYACRIKIRHRALSNLHSTVFGSRQATSTDLQNRPHNNI
jgi:hypothetical protein